MLDALRANPALLKLDLYCRGLRLAGSCYVEEAGGRFSAWDGTPTIHRTDVIASNGRLHDVAVQYLRGRG